MHRALSLAFLLLASRVSFSNALELTRGARDRFKNPQCNKTDCLATCSRYFARCASRLCRICVCDIEFSSYVATEKRCVKDEEIFGQSAPKYSSFAISDARGRQFIVVDSSDALSVSHDYTGESHQRWMYTTSGFLLNLGTLQCMENRDPFRLTVRPCRIDHNERQKWSCDRNNSRRIYQWLNGRRGYLALNAARLYLSGDELLFQWITNPMVGEPGSVCDTPDIYQGCYRFQDGSFVTRIPQPQDNRCKDQGSSDCYRHVNISAPFFVNNLECALLWNTSTFSVNDQPWTTLEGHYNHFLLQKHVGHSRKITLEMHVQAVMQWAGALVKLQVQCHDTSRKSREQHCVLLKFEGKYVGPKRQSPSTQSPITVENLKTDSGPNAYKASTIALSVVVVLLVLILVLGAFVTYRRRSSTWIKNDDYQHRPFHDAEDQQYL